MNRIISRLDIKNDFVIKGLQYEGLRKLGDPAEFAQRYYNQGADELLLVDMVASLYDRSALLDIIRTTAKNCFIPITVCGGVRSIDDFSELLAAGADKVGINTMSMLKPELLPQLVKTFGAQSVVAVVEVRKIDGMWFAYINNGKDNTNVDLPTRLEQLKEASIGEILIASIDCDGLMRGPDLQLINCVAKSTTMPIIYGGGVASIDDINRIKTLSNTIGISLASALHYNKLSINEVKDHMRACELSY